MKGVIGAIVLGLGLSGLGQVGVVAERTEKVGTGWEMEK